MVPRNPVNHSEYCGPSYFSRRKTLSLGSYALKLYSTVSRRENHRRHAKPLSGNYTPAYLLGILL